MALRKRKQIVEHANGTIIHYGDDVLIERHFALEENAEPLWFVYERKPVVDRSHPTHETETTETHVWVKAGEGSEAEARTLAEALI